MIREIHKYHDGRYRSIDAVYLCGEIGNPDKERLFVPYDKVLEIIDKRLEYIQGKKMDEIYRAWVTAENNVIRNYIKELRGEQE